VWPIVVPPAAATSAERGHHRRAPLLPAGGIEVDVVILHLTDVHDVQPSVQAPRKVDGRGHAHRGKEIHVVLDNPSTPTTPDVQTWLAAHPRANHLYVPTVIVITPPLGRDPLGATWTFSLGARAVAGSRRWTG
jgi:hypothetical protein